MEVKAGRHAVGVNAEFVEVVYGLLAGQRAGRLGGRAATAHVHVRAPLALVHHLPVTANQRVAQS